MEMLLRNVTMAELADIYRRNQSRSPAPYLLDPKAVARARQLAKKNGVWAELDKLNAARDIPVLKRSDFRNYQRTGDRLVPQARALYRRTELNHATLALWLNHPRADVDYLQDLLWAYCDDWTWVMAAHESRAIDLGSAALGATLAEILHVLGDRLEPEVKDRVSQTIAKRIFEPFWNYRHLDVWKTVRMNWNHVCNGEVIRTALYQIQDPMVLAHMTHAAIQNLTYALDGFTDDGGCEEGPGYWGYGFGHYLMTAHALYLKTKGELNIMKDPSGKIERICRYPLAAHIAGPLRSTFADSSNGYTPAFAAMIINRHFKIPELYGLCQLQPDRFMNVSAMHELAMYSGFKVRVQPDPGDYVLPDLGQAKMRGAPGKNQMTIMCLAGNNGVPHNHNDIGSFIVYQRGKLRLVDPGGPVYSQKTFSSRRYESVFCNAWGHSVPVINGVMQEKGEQYYGRLAVENLNGTGEKRAIIDMTQAYPKGTVRKLARTFALDPKANTLMLEDVYEFDRKPRSLEEGFVTFEDVRVGKKGVRIGSKADGLTLAVVNGSGRFVTVRMEKESKEGHTGQVLTRIRFIPRKLARQMTLRFRIGK